MKNFTQLLAIFSLLLLANCSTFRQTEKTLQHAEQQGFKQQLIDAPPFYLSALTHFSSDSTLLVFLEGDGHAWARFDQVSDDPTPHQPIALQLALKSHHPSVAYLARPCQYAGLIHSTACDAKYWTSHRYAPEVVDSLNLGIEQLKHQSGASSLILVGYSGGGGLVALIAAQRNDIRGLVTVAGNLDTATFNQHHNTTPMTGSVNPMSVADKLNTLPQWHLSGAKDNVVPPFMAAKFVHMVGAPERAHHIVLPGTGHQRGWVNNWPTIEQSFLN